MMKKNLKVLFLFDSPFFIPRDHDFRETFRDEDWLTEKNVYKALLANNFEVRCIGVHDDISVLTDEIKERKPDVVFSLAEVFNEKSSLDKNVVSLVEMLGLPYTGASPASLHICNNKALTKKILSYHKIKVPNFHTFYKGHKVWLPKNLKTPLIVKPLVEEASRGISQASIVDNEKSFLERIRFIHEKMKLDAIAEEYIEGRELYVSILGDKKLKVFPPIELRFGNNLKDESRIATYKAKWDAKYRKRWGIKNVFAGTLPEAIKKKIETTCKRAYRALNIRSYARFDIRLTPEGNIYILEANANPNMAKYEDFALSAEKNGIPYNTLIKKIVSLAFHRN